MVHAQIVKEETSDARDFELAWNMGMNNWFGWMSDLLVVVGMQGGLKTAEFYREIP